MPEGRWQTSRGSLRRRRKCSPRRSPTTSAGWTSQKRTSASRSRKKSSTRSWPAGRNRAMEFFDLPVEEFEDLPTRKSIPRAEPVQPPQPASRSGPRGSGPPLPPKSERSKNRLRAFPDPKRDWKHDHEREPNDSHGMSPVLKVFIAGSCCSCSARGGRCRVLGRTLRREESRRTRLWRIETRNRVNRATTTHRLRRAQRRAETGTGKESEPKKNPELKPEPKPEPKPGEEEDGGRHRRISRSKSRPTSARGDDYSNGTGASRRIRVKRASSTRRPPSRERRRAVLAGPRARSRARRRVAEPHPGSHLVREGRAPGHALRRAEQPRQPVPRGARAAPATTRRPAICSRRPPSRVWSRSLLRSRHHVHVRRRHSPRLPDGQDVVREGAPDKGQMDSQYHLGLLYDDGLGMLHKPCEARECVRKPQRKATSTGVPPRGTVLPGERRITELREGEEWYEKSRQPGETRRTRQARLDVRERA